MYIEEPTDEPKTHKEYVDKDRHVFDDIKLMLLDIRKEQMEHREETPG